MIADVTETQPPVTRNATYWRLPATLAAWLAVWVAAAGLAADIADGERLLNTGEYKQCALLAATELERVSWHEDWRLLKIRAELAEGAYSTALESTAEGLRRHPTSVQMLLLARVVFRHNNMPNEADAAVGAIQRLAVANPRRYSAPDSRVALGRFFLAQGADARQVLELFFDEVIKQRPGFVEAYLAAAELSLEKHDYALAAETLAKAPETAAEDPRFHLLRARAYQRDEPKLSSEAIAAALALNPRHLDSLLFRVDHLVDGEQYADAAEVLQQVHDVNPAHPLAWSYEAVLAHLSSDSQKERQSREKALAPWPSNPEVDHLIGRKLSENYRFAEGAEYQRRALRFDPDYRPAKMQLCQDLLRLGQEEEGWRLADEVFQSDGYNVVAHNLITLNEHISQFRTLQSDGFIVRMDAREADIYGDRVLNVLRRAKAALCEKYDVPLEGPVTVEIFPRQQDFAVRTFGMPAVSGYLGVCFGSVITANSPASQGESPSNWEAVLWHEFCHVVTLQKTRNKMPRWLSEGISVYEEKQANPTWGQSISPGYREMILGDQLTPVSELSSSFLSPPSPLHLQFAYYESSLVVEFLIDEYGLDVLKRILVDLGVGMPINDALARYTGSLELLDEEFAEFARRRAESFAPQASWKTPELPERATAADIAAWLENDPDNFRALQQLAVALLREEKWIDAAAPAKRLSELCPEYTGSNNAYGILARVYRETADEAAERAILQELARRDGDAVDAYLRLMELAAASEDWTAVADAAQRMLAAQPLVIAPHRQLATAAERLDQADVAIGAYRALLQFETSDRALAHFRLATLLNDAGHDDDARRQVLMALEEAPRYLAAHRLLLKLNEGPDADKPEESPSDSTSEAAAEPEKAQ